MSAKTYLLALLVCSLVVLPVAAAEMEATVASASAPVVVVGGPEVETLDSCSAELQCPFGTQISCTGSSSCTVWESFFFVSCDGNPVYCPCYGSVCWDGSDPTCVCWCGDAGGASMRECRLSCRQECPPITP